MLKKLHKDHSHTQATPKEKDETLRSLDTPPACLVSDPLSTLHAWKCDAMTRNVVERLANQNRVNCLFDVIGQSDMLSF